MYILLRTQTWSRVWSFPNDRIHYTPQSRVLVYALQHMETQITILSDANQKWPVGEIVRYHWILRSRAFSKENRRSTRSHPRNRVLESVPHRPGLTGVTDVHCITKGCTFHLQKKKVHNKSSDLSSYHPVAPASWVWESAENEIFPRRDAMQRGVSCAFKIQKEPRDALLRENAAGWWARRDRRRKVGQGKSVRA